MEQVEQVEQVEQAEPVVKKRPGRKPAKASPANASPNNLSNNEPKTPKQRAPRKKKTPEQVEPINELAEDMAKITLEDTPEIFAQSISQLESAQTNQINSDTISSYTEITNTSGPIEFELSSQIEQVEQKAQTYQYPQETIGSIQYTEPEYGPFGSQWAGDNQTDDVPTPEVLVKREVFDVLRAIISPAQRSEGWFAKRDGAITASDGGCVLGVNKYEPAYKFLLKKVLGSDFTGNEACYNGKKYENIATMIYGYRSNVQIDEFGLLIHPKYSFLGASPDGIVNHYKLDGIHKTNSVGTMLEIKCPLSREIKTSGSVLEICPEYYWVQVQLQLECCDLDVCDFWQCKLYEYESRSEWLADTSPTEPYRSAKSNFEKGCVIQLLPLKKIDAVASYKYNSVVYNDSIFIYPPKVEMSPYECDVWVSEQMAQIHENPAYADYYMDRVIYWRLEKSSCLPIKRDRAWFEANLPKLREMWDYVEYFRAHRDDMSIITRYIESLSQKRNEKIMGFVKLLYKQRTQGNDKLTGEELGKYNELIELVSKIPIPEPAKPSVPEELANIPKPSTPNPYVKPISSVKQEKVKFDKTSYAF